MEPELTNLFELIVALVCAMFAYAQHRRASGAIAETQAAQPVSYTHLTLPTNREV